MHSRLGHSREVRTLSRRFRTLVLSRTPALAVLSLGKS